MTSASPEPDQNAEDSPQEPLTEEDYALGETSEPNGAEREEPAGEDYAGSGF